MLRAHGEKSLEVFNLLSLNSESGHTKLHVIPLSQQACYVQLGPKVRI